jgi:hypothetical protein
MNIAWDHVRTIGTVLSILGIGAGLALWFSGFTSRLERVESQVQLLAVAPAITRSGVEYGYKPKDGDFSQPIDYSTPVSNPLIDTCKDLYKRVAAAVESKDTKVQSSLNGYMRELGCAEAIKGNAAR